MATITTIGNHPRQRTSFAHFKSVPWFIVELGSNTSGLGSFEFGFGNNLNIITNKSIPESTSSSRALNYSEVQIPGGGTAIPKFGSIGAKHIGFSLKVVNFNKKLGVVPKVAAFERLRTPAVGALTEIVNTVTGSRDAPFTPNPRVLYYYGTGSFPMIYFVTKCDLVLSYPNYRGNPQVAEVTMELIMDESSKLYHVERAYKQLMGRIGAFQSIARNGNKGCKPYRSTGFFGVTR